MPVEVGIWKMGARLERVESGRLDLEERLEACLCEDLSILAPNLMLLGRQVRTGFGKLIDILAIDSEGNLIVAELKRHSTPREVVAQVLDYGSWVQSLGYADVTQIYTDKNPGKVFEAAFVETFRVSPPEQLNREHRLYIVASELDPSTERIITYLSGSYGIPLNAVFFRYFRDGDREFLTRSWLVSASEMPEPIRSAGVRRGNETWNGQDFYFAFGDGSHRNWNDAVRYGFVSSGGGRRYTGPLQNLFIGSRIFVHIPNSGYVGVGTVRSEPIPVDRFEVEIEGRAVPILKAPLETPDLEDHAREEQYFEHFVRVDWIKTVPRSQAVWEPGMFANQNIVCRMRNAFTLRRLGERFDLDQIADSGE